MRFIFHEVSSPLNTINLGLECLKGEQLDRDGQETLNLVIHSTEEIQEVLEMFRAQRSVTANLYAKLKPVNIKEMIRSVAGKHVELADSQEVSLLLALDPRIPELLMGNDTGLRIAINRCVTHLDESFESGSPDLLCLVLFSTGYLWRRSPEAPARSSPR